jgi:dTDP-4-amino-4,6-dideoxygalactose transaminase
MRQSLALKYQEGLAGIKGIELLQRDYNTIVPHIFPVLVKNDRRDQLRDFLNKKGIETGIHYYPNHYLKFFAKRNLRLPVTEKIYSEILSLPLHPGINALDQKKIMAAMGDFFK